jgi:hypothetical protein
MEKGYIKLYRSLMDNPFYFSEKFSKKDAWIDLLLLAKHKDTFFFKRGIKIEVKRGQVCEGIINLAKRWKWSRNKTNNFIKFITFLEMISISGKKGTTEINEKGQEKGQKKGQENLRLVTLINIINYDKYQQQNEQQIEQENEQQSGQEKVQQKDMKRYTHKNVNKELQELIPKETKDLKETTTTNQGGSGEKEKLDAVSSSFFFKNNLEEDDQEFEKILDEYTEINKKTIMISPEKWREGTVKKIMADTTGKVYEGIKRRVEEKREKEKVKEEEKNKLEAFIAKIKKEEIEKTIEIENDIIKELENQPIY